MWVFAYETNKYSSVWILYGEVIRKLKYIDEDRYDVFMKDELFYGEGDQVIDSKKSGWQSSDPKTGYTIIGYHLFKTQQKAQRSGIKALFLGRIF